MLSFTQLSQYFHQQPTGKNLQEQKPMGRRCIVILSICLAIVFASAAHAQTFRGSIVGAVTDASGAAIPGAQVKVFSLGTGLSRNVTTNDLGEYLASELPLGSYSVTIAMTGFSTMTLTGIPVSAGASSRADAKLQTGAVTEAVEVTASVPLVETSSNTTGATLEASEVVDLPVNGRDYTKLVELVPGATSDPVGTTESAGSYGLFSLNGNRGRSNNYLLDGTDMNDGYRNLPAVNQAGVWGAPGTILPVDALAEIPVTGNPEAEFGRSSGATVNIVTKSGTNQIHGSAYEYFRNETLSARNYFNHFEPESTVLQPKNAFTNHQFGASAGGPIVKDDTFWYLSYEGQREDGGLPQSGTVPVQSEIDGWVGENGAVNAVIQNLLVSNPWGALPASGEGKQIFTTPFLNNSDNLIAKIDKHVGKSDLFTGRYFYSHGIQSFPLGMLYTGSSAPGYNTTTPTHVNIASLSYTSLPMPNLIVEVRGGYNRFVQQFLPEDIGLNPNTEYGLNTLPPDYSPYDLGLPTIVVSGYSSIGATGSDSRGRIDTNYQLFGNVSLVKGRHSLKSGYEWRRTFINSFINSGHRGKLVFDSLDDFLAGNLNTGSSMSAEGYGTRYSYQNSNGAYILDSWRFSNKITLNLGLRWDYYGVIGAKNNAFSLFNVTTGDVETVGANGGPSSLYPKDWTNFAPRISVADDLLGNQKLVVRSSVGIFYDGASQDFFVGNQPWNTYTANAGPAFNDILFAWPVSSTIQEGVPIFGDITNYAPNSLFTVDQKLKTPRYYSYGLNIESQLTPKIAVQIGYVGSQGRHLFRIRDLDQYNNVDGREVSCGNGQTIGYGESCFPDYWYINQVETSSLSNYNSLQNTLKIQNWRGLTSTLNYTWAHSIDDASDGTDFVPNAAMPDDSWNPHAERANSNYDIRQRVQWYWTYALPIKSKQAGWLVNGWAANGLFNFATGQPYTVHYLYEDDYNGSGEWFGRPDIIGNVYEGASGTNMLNLSAFAAPCTWDAVEGACVSGTQHPGSEGRNQFKAPNFTNMDFSLNKTSHITEKLTMQLRADFFNLFNHVNLSNPLMPSFSIDVMGGAVPLDPDSNSTRLVAGTSSQFLQTTATPDVGTGNPYLGGGGPRSAQLAVHFTF
jgi:hypothetical protein